MDFFSFQGIKLKRLIHIVASMSTVLNQFLINILCINDGENIKHSKRRFSNSNIPHITSDKYYNLLLGYSYIQHPWLTNNV
jgi:hypothetical protein